MNNLSLEITASFESGINVFDTADVGARHLLHLNCPRAQSSSASGSPHPLH